ncbi:LOW QUALITY PROTEIN: uncharacterized protein PS065_010276 [Dugong dugon]
MAWGRNSTTITRFVLLGLYEFPKLTIVLFSIFLGIYLLTVFWNVSLITLIRVDSHLHTPMYFFLSNLSFLDICYVSAIAPRMLSDFFQKQNSISFMGCTMQYFFFSNLGLNECCLLASMAYDRYAAICNPLLYTAIVSPAVCLQIVTGSCLTGFFGSFVQLCALLQLHFCGPNFINHFFCNLPQLLILSCSDTFFFQVVPSLLTVIFGLACFVIMISYGYIVATILKITSAEGRSKAFITCVSHLAAVTLFFGSGIFVYMYPNSGILRQNKLVSVLYTAVIPMLNPLIYSLRNKEIKDALNRWKKRISSWYPKEGFKWTPDGSASCIMDGQTAWSKQSLEEADSHRNAPLEGNCENFKTVAGGRNNTVVTKFILLGFSNFPKFKIALFAVFLRLYLLTMAWNLGLITLIKMDSHLHTPMYFFLDKLAFLDICYVSSTDPKMLSDFFQEQKPISFMGCTMQYFFSSLGLTECCLLAAMAYDRYTAICSPLLCTAIMSPTLYLQMMIGVYVTGTFGSLIQLCALLQLDFCGPNVINHFFCDLPQLLILSCSDTFYLQVMKFVIAVIFGVASVLVIMISSYIIATILKVSSVEGRYKAFNTCASHLTAVTFFFGSGLFVYMHPSCNNSPSYDKMASVFYTVVNPMLNPLIYSLRNKEIKDALKRCEKKRVFSHCH